MLKQMFCEVDTWGVKASGECIKDIGCPDDGDEDGYFEDAIESNGGEDQGIEQLRNQSREIVAQPKPARARFELFQKMITGYIIELTDQICAQ